MQNAAIRELIAEIQAEDSVEGTTKATYVSLP